jgi:hypothetical protein
MAEPIAQVLLTQTTTGVEKARFELLMRKWRTKLYNTKVPDLTMSAQKVFVNNWLNEFEEIFRQESAKINTLAGYGGFISANGANDVVSSIDDYLANYRQTVTALTNKDLVQARSARNGMALAFRRKGIGNFFDELAEFDKEARALGLTQRERVNSFLNTIGKNQSTITTFNRQTNYVMRWKPDAYARMYANTRDSQLRDEIFQDQLIELDSDTVQVSSHGTTTPICQQYEGKIFSLTGKNPSLPVLQQRPGFHPSCKHVLLSRPRMTNREARKINFVQGKKLSVQKKNWPDTAKKTINKQEVYNLKNRPPKAGVE